MKCCLCKKEMKDRERNSVEPLNVPGKKIYCCDKCNQGLIVPMRYFLSIGQDITREVLQLHIDNNINDL